MYRGSQVDVYTRMQNLTIMCIEFFNVTKIVTLWGSGEAEIFF